MRYTLPVCASALVVECHDREQTFGVRGTWNAGSATSWLGDIGHITFQSLSCPICKKTIGIPTSRDVVRMDSNVREAPHTVPDTR